MNALNKGITTGLEKFRVAIGKKYSTWEAMTNSRF